MSTDLLSSLFAPPDAQRCDACGNVGIPHDSGDPRSVARDGFFFLCRECGHMMVMTTAGKNRRLTRDEVENIGRQPWFPGFRDWREKYIGGLIG